MSTDKRFSRSERALIAVGIIVPSLVLAGVGINAKLNDVPPLVLPQHTLPVPNAHDTLRAARVAMVVYKDDPKTPLPLAERTALVAANTEAIATLRHALSQEYRQPLTYDSNQSFPEYAEQRELARLLTLASQTSADSGDFAQAAQYATDAIALGIKIPRGGSLIGQLVGMACEAIGRNALLKILDTLDTATLKATLARLDTLESERWPLAETLEVEHLWSQKTIRDLAKQNPMQAVQMFGINDGNQSRTLAWRIAFTPKQLVVENNHRYYATLIAQVKKPYQKGVITELQGMDAINELLFPAIWQTRFRDAQNRTEGNLLRARLALRLTGKLDPRFTDALGQDQPLRFKKDGDKFTLYSVGPDGDDDNGRAGTPSQEPLAKREHGRVLNVDDEGDLVAGINTY